MEYLPEHWNYLAARCIIHDSIYPWYDHQCKYIHAFRRDQEWKQPVIGKIPITTLCILVTIRWVIKKLSCVENWNFPLHITMFADELELVGNKTYSVPIIIHFQQGALRLHNTYFVLVNQFPWEISLYFPPLLSRIKEVRLHLPCYKRMYRAEKKNIVF